MYDKKKLIIIMRHAKSDRSPLYDNDFERPLNDRGQHQPKDIAKQFNKLGISVDKVLVSSARRTKETWELLAKHLDDAPKPLFEPRLYEASLDEILDVLSEHSDCDHLMMVGHCPGVNEIAEYLTGDYVDFKTANLAILSAGKEDLDSGLKKPGRFTLEKMLVTDE